MLHGPAELLPISSSGHVTLVPWLLRRPYATELDPELRHYNPIGSMHGGVFATLLDSACGCAVHSTLAVGESSWVTTSTCDGLIAVGGGEAAVGLERGAGDVAALVLAGAAGAVVARHAR